MIAEALVHAAGTESLGGVVAQCPALAHLDFNSIYIHINTKSLKTQDFLDFRERERETLSIKPCRSSRL
jgi:hypothetical protein